MVVVLKPQTGRQRHWLVYRYIDKLWPEIIALGRKIIYVAPAGSETATISQMPTSTERFILNQLRIAARKWGTQLQHPSEFVRVKQIT